MKLLFLTFLFLLQFISSFGQVTKDSNPPKSSLSDSERKELTNREYSKVVNSNMFSPIVGSSATLEILNAELDFNGNMQFDNGSIFGLKVKGGVTDGLIPIFTNTELNTNLNINLQYNWLFKSCSAESINYNTIMFERYNNKKKELEKRKKSRGILSK
ncbi:MAG: hypothetical protein IPN76_17000 [Saprospiraceae bacterium]|nr:hypothetical protein [Saprospiraceae bacterium]